MPTKKAKKDSLPTDAELILFSKKIRAMMFIREHVRSKGALPHASMPYLIFLMLIRDKDFFTFQDMMNFCETTKASMMNLLGEMRRKSLIEKLSTKHLTAGGTFSLTYEGREFANWIFKEFVEQKDRRRRSAGNLKERAVKSQGRKDGLNIL